MPANWLGLSIKEFLSRSNENWFSLVEQPMNTTEISVRNHHFGSRCFPRDVRPHSPAPFHRKLASEKQLRAHFEKLRYANKGKLGRISGDGMCASWHSSSRSADSRNSTLPTNIPRFNHDGVNKV